MNNFKIGDKVVFEPCDENMELTGLTFGKIYTVSDTDWFGCAFFIDDVGDANYAGMDEDCYGIGTLITE